MRHYSDGFGGYLRHFSEFPAELTPDRCQLI